MAEPIKERAVRIVLIPQSLYKKLEKRAKKTDASVMGLTCRAIVDFMQQTPHDTTKNHAQSTNEILNKKN